MAFAVLAALGPKEVSVMSSLLPGGSYGAPKVLFKQLNEELNKRHKYLGKDTPNSVSVCTYFLILVPD